MDVTHETAKIDMEGKIAISASERPHYTWNIYIKTATNKNRVD